MTWRGIGRCEGRAGMHVGVVDSSHMGIYDKVPAKDGGLMILGMRRLGIKEG